MAFEPCIGQLTVDPRAIYEDQHVLESIASAALYTSNCKRIQLYTGDKKPIVVSRNLDNAYKFGQPIRESMSGVYLMPFFSRENSDVVKGYATFIESANEISPMVVYTSEEKGDVCQKVQSHLGCRLLDTINAQLNIAISAEELEAVLYQTAEYAINRYLGINRLYHANTNFDSIQIIEHIRALAHRLSGVASYGIFVLGTLTKKLYILVTYMQDMSIGDILTFVMVNDSITSVTISQTDIRETITAPNRKERLPIMEPLLTRQGFIKRDKVYAIPMAVSLSERFNISMEDAVIMIEQAVEYNPYILLEYIDTCYYDNYEDYVNDLYASYQFAHDVTDGDTELLYEALLLEDIQSKARSLGSAISDAADKGKRKIVAAGKAAHSVIAPLANMVTKTIDGLKEKMDETDREAAITGSSMAKLRSLFMKCIAPAAAVTIATGPALGIISFLMLLSRRAKDDAKAQRSILTEMEHELKMTREKIEDAKSAGDNEKKYQLMRIEHKIEQNIEAIRLDMTRSKL